MLYYERCKDAPVLPIQLPVPVAQLVERWTPPCESTDPGYKSPGSRRDGRLIFMSLLAGMVAVGGRP